MKLSEIVKDVKLEELKGGETEITGISYDSRAVKPGDLFVAIKGFEFDGHKYIPAAIEAGASAILCQEKPDADIAYALTSDSRLALALAGREFYGDPASEMTIVGVTGTNGKTTTTYLLKHLLESKLDAKVGLIGTNGNMIGSEFLHSERTTPESLELQRLFREMADSGCTHVVMEVSSHSLCLDRVAGIHFDVGIFTNLTQDHLDFHGTMEEYAKAKAKLFRMCTDGCFNADDAWCETMTKDATCKIHSYAIDSHDTELYADDVKLSPSGIEFYAVSGNERVKTKLCIPGKFSVYNALCVMSAGLALGISLSDCADAVGSAKGVKGRMELVPTDGDYTIVIDYSHTPDALENALKALRINDEGRLVALFGCGGDRDRTKRPIMGAVAAKYADFVIVTSDNPRTEEPQSIIDEIVVGMSGSDTPYTVICDRPDAIRWAIDNHRPHDVILLAGKGHEDYQVVGHEKHHMDEREIVAEHIEKR